MITNAERSILKQIIQDPKFVVIEKIINMLQLKIQEESSLRDTEWETIKTVLINEGQVQGLRRLYQELIIQSQNA